MNLLYALLQLALGIVNRSVWFYALAGYYFLLAVIRISLLYAARRIAPGEDRIREYHCCRLCGAALLFMDIYPVYSRITKKERERLAPEILKLTEELMK